MKIVSKPVLIAPKNVSDLIDADILHDETVEKDQMADALDRVIKK